jgi:hypothetical protein
VGVPDKNVATKGIIYEGGNVDDNTSFNDTYDMLKVSKPENKSVLGKMVCLTLIFFAL